MRIQGIDKRIAKTVIFAKRNSSDFKTARRKGIEVHSAMKNVKGWYYKGKFYSNPEWIKKILK